MLVTFERLIANEIVKTRKKEVAEATTLYVSTHSYSFLFLEFDDERAIDFFYLKTDKSSSLFSCNFYILEYV